jgi:hypothetical protein
MKNKTCSIVLVSVDTEPSLLVTDSVKVSLAALRTLLGFGTNECGMQKMTLPELQEYLNTLLKGS